MTDNEGEDADPAPPSAATTDDPAGPAPGRPVLRERARAEQAARAERQARALRDNLRRRKDQQRARASEDPPR